MGPSDFFFLSLSRDTPVGYVRVRWHKIYKPDIRGAPPTDRNRTLLTSNSNAQEMYEHAVIYFFCVQHLYGIFENGLRFSRNELGEPVLLCSRFLNVFYTIDCNVMYTFKKEFGNESMLVCGNPNKLNIK